MDPKKPLRKPLQIFNHHVGSLNSNQALTRQALSFQKLVLKTYIPHTNHAVLPSAIVLKYGRKPFDDDEADVHGEVSVEKSGGSPPDFLFCSIVSINNVLRPGRLLTCHFLEKVYPCHECTRHCWRPTLKAHQNTCPDKRNLKESLIPVPRL